jgi:nitrate/TMAO reductase-like tetraheme cytochrome c subunit
MAESRSRLVSWLSPFVYLSNNPLSLVGVILVTSATVLFIAMLPTLVTGTAENPYLGLLIFIAFPAVFIGGLLLIPFGMLLRRRTKKHSGLYPASFPPLDFTNREFKKLVGFILATTVVNVVIAGQLTYGALHYMDSVEFCGKTCHTVMQPEYTAYQNSPHARVECVKCHIGPGAGWFVKSKLSGTWQVIAVTTNIYPRPIPTPVHNLRPARDTCETCHWPQKFGGERLRVLTKFAEDEVNTETKTALLMKIGGGAAGIHGRHMAPGVQMRYAPADESRQNIPVVEYTKGDGKWVRFVAAGTKPEDVQRLSDPATMRLMDCMDCHNRPSHTYELPERAVDKAMADGSISPSLPFAKKQALALLKADYPTQSDATAKITAGFEAFYRDKYAQMYSARREDVTRSARAVATVYNNNVFPEMRVKWGSYPNNLGHTDFPGCFRCHDDNHASPAGEKIAQDCSSCHSLLAMEEPAPKILTDLGVAAAQAGGSGGK